MKRALPAAGLLAAAAALCLISYESNAGKTLLFCPQFRLTGLYCPGCGTMRALGCLLHGQVGAAFLQNPLTAALLPLLAVLGLWWLVGYVVTGGDVILYRIPAWVYYTVLAALMLFGVVRNIPLPLLDCLRPPA